jgi:hypothetical protein
VDESEAALEGPMKCDCRATQLGFAEWKRFQDAANDGEKGFGQIARKAGVYCIRVSRAGKETRPSEIVKKYKQSPLYTALKSLGQFSDGFFESCGFGKGWGWSWYVTDADKDLSKIEFISTNARGNLDCPILYIGCSRSPPKRMRELMYLAHVVNHPLWALLCSGWNLEIASRSAQDYKEEEGRLKEAYGAVHGRLPPLMVE